MQTKLAEYEKIKQSAEVAEEAAARLLHKCALVQKENRGLVRTASDRLDYLIIQYEKIRVKHFPET